MGLPVDLFVSKPDDDFICSICHDVFEDPVMVDSGCEHVFCKTCMIGMRSHQTNILVHWIEMRLKLLMLQG